MRRALVTTLLLTACGGPTPPAHPSNDNRARATSDSREATEHDAHEGGPDDDERLDSTSGDDGADAGLPGGGLVEGGGGAGTASVACDPSEYRVETCVSPGMPRRLPDGTLDGSPRCSVQCRTEPPTGSPGGPCGQTGPRSYSCHYAMP